MQYTGNEDFEYGVAEKCVPVSEVAERRFYIVFRKGSESGLVTPMCVVEDFDGKASEELADALRKISGVIVPDGTEDAASFLTELMR